MWPEKHPPASIKIAEELGDGLWVELMPDDLFIYLAHTSTYEEMARRFHEIRQQTMTPKEYRYYYRQIRRFKDLLCFTKCSDGKTTLLDAIKRKKIIL